MLFLRRGEKPSTRKKNTGSKGEKQQQTQPTLTWRRRQDLNPGHVRERRRGLSLLRHSYPSLKMAIDLSPAQNLRKKFFQKVVLEYNIGGILW